MYDQSLGMSTADGRPLRPNSIELRGHYVNAQTGVCFTIAISALVVCNHMS